MPKHKPRKRAAAAAKPRMPCPFCQCALNFKIDGFSCYGAVVGTYTKGSIWLECSQLTCPYRHSINFKATDAGTIEKVENAIASLVTRLPTLGPWEILAISEKGKRQRRFRTNSTRA